jgi:gluconolactonase
MTIQSAAVVAESLGFPEGPLVLGPCRVAFVELYRASISVFDQGAVRTLAVVGGCPNGLARGPDGRIYFTQNSGGGGWYRCPDPKAPGIYALDPVSGSVEQVTTKAGTEPLRQPNDLCFGPDGALWFTDPGTDPQPQPGWICRHSAGSTQVVHQLGPVFPNGIGFDAEGHLIWSETRTRTITAAGDPPSAVSRLQAPARPDGFAVCANGTVVVATLQSGGLDFVAPRGRAEPTAHRQIWAEDVVATNCAFEGSTLWVTDASSASDDVERPSGRLWRLETNLAGKELL